MQYAKYLSIIIIHMCLEFVPYQDWPCIVDVGTDYPNAIQACCFSDPSIAPCVSLVPPLIPSSLSTSSLTSFSLILFSLTQSSLICSSLNLSPLILSSPIPSFLILSSLILSALIPSFLILSSLILSSLIPSFLIPSSLILSSLILSSLVPSSLIPFFIWLFSSSLISFSLISSSYSVLPDLNTFQKSCYTGGSRTSIFDGLEGSFKNLSLWKNLIGFFFVSSPTHFLCKTSFPQHHLLNSYSLPIN